MLKNSSSSSQSIDNALAKKVAQFILDNSGEWRGDPSNAFSFSSVDSDNSDSSDFVALRNGVYIFLERSEQAKLHDLTKDISKKLGHLFDEYRMIQSIIFDCMAIQHKDPFSQVEDIERLLKTKFNNYRSQRKAIFVPCLAYDVDQSFTGMSIDGLELDFGDAFANRVNFNFPDVSIHSSSINLMIDKSNTISFPIPRLCWHIDVFSGTEHYPDEAFWTAGILNSYILIAFGHTLNINGEDSFYFELDPAHEPNSKSILIGYNETSIGPVEKLRFFQKQITKETVDLSKTDAEIARARAVFQSDPGTIGDRLRAALGWLSRGRQARSRSDKILHYFTSIETLLSNTDPREPVTQTIARNLSAIWTNRVNERIVVFNEIIQLYTVRSKLIHQGSREIQTIYAEKVERYAHTICKIILMNCMMSMKVDEFQKHLKECSFGLDFPSNSASD
jgi:hypothetical protein